MVLVNSGFHMQKNSAKNCPQFGHTSSKLFASPLLSLRSLQNIRLEGCPIISLRRAPTSWAGPTGNAFPYLLVGLIRLCNSSNKSECLSRSMQQEQWSFLTKMCTSPLWASHNLIKMEIICQFANHDRISNHVPLLVYISKEGTNLHIDP